MYEGSYFYLDRMFEKVGDSFCIICNVNIDTTVAFQNGYCYTKLTKNYYTKNDKLNNAHQSAESGKDRFKYI